MGFIYRLRSITISFKWCVIFSQQSRDSYNVRVTWLLRKDDIINRLLIEIYGGIRTRHIGLGRPAHVSSLSLFFSLSAHDFRSIVQISVGRPLISFRIVTAESGMIHDRQSRLFNAETVYHRLRPRVVVILSGVMYARGFVREICSALASFHRAEPHQSLSNCSDPSYRAVMRYFRGRRNRQEDVGLSLRVMNPWTGLATDARFSGVCYGAVGKKTIYNIGLCPSL